MYRTQFVPLNSIDPPAPWHNKASKATRIQAMHIQAIRIIVLVRKRSQLHIVYDPFYIYNNECIDRSFYMRIIHVTQA